jgi:hypothetical protein
MPLVEFLERFGLDRELIERDRAMSAGFARAYARRAEDSEDEEERFLHVLAAATEYRRAGAHSVLLSNRRFASEYFEQAGLLYGRMHNPYGLLMTGCADYSPRDLMEGAREAGIREERITDRLQLGYLNIVRAAADWEYTLDEAISGSLASPVGLLGLPLGAYTDLALALSRKEPQAVFEATAPFLSAYNNCMKRAREDNYHWRRLAMPFHPAEPDILSVVFLVEAAARLREQRFFPEILGSVPMVRDAANLLYNAVAERFGDAH